MSGTRLAKTALIALCLLPATACVSLLPESEPVSVYRLSSPDPQEWGGNSEDWTIVEIEVPQAPRGLSGDHIALLRDGQSLAYIEGARWISPVPRLLQNLVIDTFNAEQSQLAPARPEDGVRADYELHLDLRQFEADYDQGAGAAPTVRGPYRRPAGRRTRTAFRRGPDLLGGTARCCQPHRRDRRCLRRSGRIDQPRYRRLDRDGDAGSGADPQARRELVTQASVAGARLSGGRGAVITVLGHGGQQVLPAPSGIAPAAAGTAFRLAGTGIAIRLGIRAFGGGSVPASAPGWAVSALSPVGLSVRSVPTVPPGRAA